LSNRTRSRALSTCPKTCSTTRAHLAFLLLLNKNKQNDRLGKLFLVNASQVVEKGDPKNFIPPAGIERIATAFKAWQKRKVRQDRHARAGGEGGLQHLPIRYIHVAHSETQRRSRRF
jgi:type I restriction enzyme M protein